MRNLARRHPVLVFVGFTLAYSWGLWGLMIGAQVMLDLLTAPPAQPAVRRALRGHLQVRASTAAPLIQG